jgi:phytanoyl-CoA hydroxylase
MLAAVTVATVAPSHCPCSTTADDGGEREQQAVAAMALRKKSQFETDGFALLEQVLDSGEMARIEHELARFVQEDMPAGRGPWDGKIYTCEVEGDLSTVWRISPLNTPYLDQLGSTTLTTIWQTMFGVASAGAPASQFFDKFPRGTKDTPAHQDGGFTLPRVLNNCAEMGNCVIVLDDMDEANGCLHYVPGSHRALRRHKDGVVGFSRALADWSADDDAAEVPMVCRRGDVLVHHCLTVHRAGVNSTPDRHRRTIGFSYRSINVQLGAEIKNKGIVVGGKLVKGLYNDSEEERASFDQRFGGMSREELLKTARIWGLEQESVEGSLDSMAEDKLRGWLRKHAPL